MLENLCAECFRECPGDGGGCKEWKEYFVKNWDQNIHRKKIEHIIEDQSKRCAWQYEHPDLVGEGIVWTGERRKDGS